LVQEIIEADEPVEELGAQRAPRLAQPRGWRVRCIL
jgi:hypothetical protein